MALGQHRHQPRPEVHCYDMNTCKRNYYVFLDITTAVCINFEQLLVSASPGD